MPTEFVIENLDKGRRYVFRPLRGSKVQVRRWEYLKCAREQTLDREGARRLYRWMTRYLGYVAQDRNLPKA